MNLESIPLSNGVKMPRLGYGVYQVDPATCEASVREALEVGYRAIDTAQAYHNEEGVGRAIKGSGLPREDIFLTTKVWVSNAGQEKARASIEESLRKLQTDYIDLLLIHQPFNDYYGTWRAMEEAYKAGKVRAIGVSNFLPHHLEPLLKTEVAPMVNQVECNPYFQQRPLRRIMAEKNVLLEAWGPLGQGSAKLLTDPVVLKIAEKYGKNAGQVILRFETQDGIVVLPKSTKKERIAGNLNIFAFTLTDAEMQELRALDTGKGSHDPDAPGVGDYLLSAFDVHAND